MSKKYLNRWHKLAIVSIMALAMALTGYQALAALTLGATYITSDGAVTINGVAASTYAIGAATTTGTITIGGTAQTGDLTVGSSSGINALKLGNGNGVTTVTIAGGTGGNTVNIATDNTAADTVSVGSALDSVALTSAKWTIGANGAFVISPTANSVKGMNITGTTGTAAVAFQVNQAGTANTSWFNSTNASGVIPAGVEIEQTGAGTTTSALLISGTAGTITNGIKLNKTSGTIGTDIVLQNSETISNATDGTIDLGAANLKFSGNFTGKNINIVPASIGTAGVKFFTAGTSTAILDVGAQTDRVYGFGTHLTTNFAGADTWVKGLDARIVVTGGTQGNVQGVYSGVTKSGGVAPAQELWGASNAVTITGGSVANTYGVVGEVDLGASATAGVASGTDASTPNYITALLAKSTVASAATLSDDSVEAPVIALVANGGAARSKATAAVVAILGGDNAFSNTAGAAFKAMDYSSTSGYNFDYGLDFGPGVGGVTGPIGGRFGVTGNTFTQADIRLMNGETIDNKTDGKITLVGSLVQQKGSDVASTAAMTLGQGNVFVITGTADITSITAASTDAGREVTLIFSGTAGAAGVTDGSNLKLNNSFGYTPDDTLTLVSDGTNWYETGRTAN
ncbi:MAG: hypothetical protein HY974_03045 [Candidatus Kerfeldbacteria bacterium]|nr:hypothetical protein [Candidatus Kerfeldbacteria bacterium]